VSPALRCGPASRQAPRCHAPSGVLHRRTDDARDATPALSGRPLGDGLTARRPTSQADPAPSGAGRAGRHGVTGPTIFGWWGAARRAWRSRTRKPRRASGGRLPETVSERNGLPGGARPRSRTIRRWMGNGKGARARGDASAAAAGGESSGGWSIGEEASEAVAGTRRTRRPKPGEPHGRQWDATSPRRPWRSKPSRW